MADLSAIRERVLRNAASEAALESNPEESGTLANSLYRTYVSTYEARISAEHAALGLDTSDGTSPISLTNPDVLDRLAEQAMTTAKDIYQTYQADLAAFFDSADPAWSASDLKSALSDWAAERDAWKTDQIATTEASKASGAALSEFVDRSGVQGTADFGYHLECALCKEIADLNPYDINDPAVGEIPHPSCMDSWQTTIASIDSPWDGS